MRPKRHTASSINDEELSALYNERDRAETTITETAAMLRAALRRLERGRE